ncbi:MAG TPA: YDG domain-containing protein, partial [Verrucomicrobiota bacterium]|nr:YDG domain-containing protein [Verrucomicrobiota bacterium]
MRHSIKTAITALVAAFSLLHTMPAFAWTHDSGDQDNNWEGTTWYGICSWMDGVYYPNGAISSWDAGWDFRGRFKHSQHLDCDAGNNRGANVDYRMYRRDGSEKSNHVHDQCGWGAGWHDIMEDNWNGDGDRFWRCRINSAEAAKCFTYYSAMVAGRARTYGEKWDYINDWVCLGGYSGVIGDNATGWTESDIYLYPAVDTTHGNVFNYGGKIPGRVQTGDCNNANKLDWKGNAASYGNCDNCYSFGFAWMYAPSGAGPRFLIGADDDQRTYVNGTMISSGNLCCNRDAFETGGISMPSGWSRILFKVRNGGGGFNGTVSLRNGGDRGWNEGSVTRYSSSYGLGYEQDDWYPRTTVSSFYGTSSPADAGNFYGNNTTVAANGTASVTGPVPYWRTMQYQWGNGFGGVEGNYADVKGSPTSTSWSHSESGVTGHRRFHFFAVSKSKRTSGQHNGKTGGWTWGSPGARYYDVFVDNVAPNNPSFSSVSAVSTTQINLGWSIPTDKGVGVADGSDETTGKEGAAEAQNWYRRGDVGVYVRADGGGLWGWGGAGSTSHTGLGANTPHTYTIEARDNTGGGRGSWYNYTGQQGSTTKYTWQNTPAAPTFGTVTENSIVLNTANPVNLTAGTSGVYFDSTTAGGDTGINAWVQATTDTATGLAANTQYTFQAKARNGDSVETGYSGTASAWTLSVPPAAGTVTAPAVTYGDNVTWTAVNGFGAGKVQYYRYVFDRNATKTSWSDTETQWSSGTLSVQPTEAGTWYLHIKGYNGVNVGNGYYNYAVTVNPKHITGTFTAGSKVYDAQTTAGVVSRGLNGLVFSDAVTLDGGTANFADRHVGTGKTVSLTGATLGGAKAVNYVLDSVATTTASITPKALTVTGLTASA